MILMLVYFILLGLVVFCSVFWMCGVFIVFFLVIVVCCVGEMLFSIGNMIGCDIVLYLILFMMVVNEVV